MGGSALKYAGASRPLIGEAANGDQWLIQRRPDGARVALVDGLGHGPEAEAAAIAAIDALRAAPDLPPVPALLRCDEALRGTRGAALSLLAIDTAKATLHFAGVGNVEGQLRGGTRERLFAPDRGILGRGIREPHLLELSLGTEWMVLLYSDGIRARDLGASVGPGRSAADLAQLILAERARPTDDATVVVVTSEPDDSPPDGGRPAASATGQPSQIAPSGGRVTSAD